MKYLLLYNTATGAIVGHAIIPDAQANPDADAGYAYLEAILVDWEFAASVDVAGAPTVVLGGTQLRFDPASRPRTTEEITQDNGLYRAGRRAAYDPISDQLDRITATLERLHDQGIDIGKDGREQVKRWRAVKRKFPKPGTPSL